MKKTVLAISLVMTSLSFMSQAAEETLEKPKITCDQEKGTLRIESAALNPNIDDALIAKESIACFKGKKSYKKILADVMIAINPKENYYQCNTEKEPTLLVLKTWEAGRPGLVSDGDTEDPKMETVNERSLLIRSPISCYAKMSTGLFSGIQGGVNMILKIMDHNVFRMNSDKDQSRTVTIDLESITQ